jgi:hypothetical protein
LVIVSYNNSKIILIFVAKVNAASLTSIIIRIVIVVSLRFCKIGFCGLEFCESGYKAICKVRGRVS